MITKSIAAPTLANMVKGGGTPFLPAAELQEMGYRVAINHNSLTRTLVRAGQRALRQLQSTGSTQRMATLMIIHCELWWLFEWEK